MARYMWDMPHAAIKVNILSHGHASDDPEKAGAAPYEMTVPPPIADVPADAGTPIHPR